MSITSRHLTAVTVAAQAGAHMLLRGSTADEALFEGEVRSGLHGLVDALRAGGMERVVSFDASVGFHPGPDLDAAETVLRGIESGEAPDLSLRGPLDVADVARALVTLSEAPTAVVITDVDLLLAPANETCDTAVAVLRAAVRDAVSVRGDGGRLPLRNLLVLVLGPGASVPYSLDDTPGVRTIAVERPSLDEREHALGMLLPYFHGDRDLDDATRARAKKQLARVTAERSLRELEQLRRVSASNRLPATASRRLLRLLDAQPPNPFPDLDLPTLERDLRARTIGQDHVVDFVLGVVRSLAFPEALRDPLGNTGPPAHFTLLGLPGCGKTDLATGLALAVYGSAQRKVDVAAGSMQLAHETAWLHGAPPGYTGYGEGGSIAERVERFDGRCVLLIDEFDRGSRGLLEALLSILSEGRLRNGRSGTVDLSETLVVLTSNCGEDELREHMAAHGGTPSPEKVREIHREALRAQLVTTPIEREGLELPALWSRIAPRLLVFDVLRDAAIPGIVEKFTGWVQTTAAQEWNVRVRVDTEGLERAIRGTLGAEGDWDAREIRGQVDARLQVPLKDALLLGEISRGESVVVEYPDGRAAIRSAERDGRAAA